VRSPGGKIAADVIGTLAAVARVDRANDRIVIAFDRDVPHHPAFAVPFLR
jgi:hypothetical protein